MRMKRRWRCRGRSNRTAMAASRRGAWSEQRELGSGGGDGLAALRWESRKEGGADQVE